VVTALLEQIRDLGFQFCVVDPEGDYAEFPDAVVVGNAKQEPSLKEVVRLLGKPEVSVVVNLLAIDPSERPRFLAKFLPEIAKLRAETGRPHWLVFDEGALAIIENFCTATGRGKPKSVARRDAGQVYALARDGTLQAVTPIKPKERQKRHARKYAEGDLGEDRSFYFRGPNGALNLRAQNLSAFLQMAAGVDDATWVHHLKAGQYSKWFQEAIKDDELASEARIVEADASLSAGDSRQRLKEIIERRYTAPAGNL
jgi:hypothetical protein